MKVDNNSPSFKHVSLVRVSKRAFKNPEDLEACEREFGIQLSKIRGDKIGGTSFGFYFNRFLQSLFRKSVKIVSGMEGLHHRTVDKFPQKEYHSFAIYTGKDAPKILNIVSKKNCRKLRKIAAAEYTFENYMEQFRDVRRFITPADRALCFKKYMAEQKKRGAELLFKQAGEAFQYSKVQEFRINSLGEMKDIKDKFGLNQK